MANKLILRSKQSPFTGQFSDINKGSVLSHNELDNNFINLKGNLIYTAETIGNVLHLQKIDGTSIEVEIPNSSGGTSGDTFIETGYTIGDTIILERNDGVNIEVPIPHAYISGDTFIETGYTINNELVLERNDGIDISILLPSGGTTADTFIESGYTVDNLLVLERNDGEDISILLPSGGTTADTFIESGYTIDNLLILERNDGEDIEIVLPTLTGSTCPSGLTIYDEGLLVDTNVCSLNFIGDDVKSLQNGDGHVDIYIPSPQFASHWNTTDGTTDGIVSENELNRTIARMSTPNVAEGNPFYIGNWATTNQDATLESQFIFQPVEEVTGFGGDSRIKAEIFAGNDVSIGALITPPIVTDFSVIVGPIQIEITNYSADLLKFKAKPIVTIDMATLIPNGGKVKVVITHTTDTTTDGGDVYTYEQDYVFYDNNPTTPQINGSVTMSETNGQVLTKHISGIEYYVLNSNFTVDITNIDDLNENSQATGDTLTLTASEYGLSTLTPEPFNELSSSFIGWTNDNNSTNVGFNYDTWSITNNNYRFRNNNANSTARPRDEWDNGSVVNSPNESILIDTYGDTSTYNNETFDSETWRLSDSNYNTSWDSTNTLVLGQALVMGGQLMIPSSGTKYDGSSNDGVNGDWSAYKPDLNGSNPNYTTLSGASNFYRKFFNTSALSADTEDLSNFTINFTGNFKGGNALTDLINSDIEIYIRKIDSSVGGALVGPTAPAGIVHGATPYAFGGDYDLNQSGPQRTNSSNNNNIVCSFGVWPSRQGILFEVKINDPAIKITSINITFNA